MTEILTPDQHAWLQTHVAAGEFASIEQAARQLIDESIATRAALEQDDLAWAKPYVDAALTQADRGDIVTRDQYRARLDQRPALKD